MTLVGFVKDWIRGRDPSRLEEDNYDPSNDPGWKARRETLRSAEGKVKGLSGYEKYFGTESEIHNDHPVSGTSQRKAVATLNAYWGIYGIYREYFYQADNDRLARNPIFAICEKGIMDYLGIVEWEIIDHKEDQVKKATDFLKRPNPQDTFPTILKQTARDVIRYDAGAWVKTLSTPDSSDRQYLLELKAYSGPEFWIEIDRDWAGIPGEGGQVYVGPYSTGYVKRYWQHSKAGIFIPFEPKEIVYFVCYPRSDSCYGTDFMQELKWYLEYLIDSTKAAGMTFANGIMPGMKYKHPQYSSVTQLIEANKELESANLGPDNFNGIVNLIGEEDIEPLTPTMVDMQWLEGQTWVAKIIWAMFGFSSSEFVGDDVNRATAYVARNITKSRMLSPLLRKFEEMINENVLPDLPGYEPGWKFRFKDVIDLDDELKQTQIDQGRAQVTQTYMQMGVPIEAALTIAGVSEEKIERVKKAMEEAQAAEPGWDQGMQGGGGPMGPPGPEGGLIPQQQQESPDEQAGTFGTAASQDHEGSDEDQEDIQKAAATEDGRWVTTDEGNHIFITEGGEMRTGPGGKVIGYSKKGGEAPDKVDDPTTKTIRSSKTVTDFIQAHQGKPKSDWITAAMEKHYEGPNGNTIAHEIYTEKGYTAKPSVVTEQELNSKIEEGGLEVFRGVTHPDHAEKLRSGEMYAGSGITGSGIYAVGPAEGDTPKESLNRAVAYSKGEYGKDKGAVVRIVIPKTAKIIDYDDVKGDFRDWYASESDEMLKELIRDPGVYAAIKGYDVIRDQHQGCMYYTVLNRGAISIQDSNLQIQKKKNKDIQKAGFNPDEPREDDGKWTGGAGGKKGDNDTTPSENNDPKSDPAVKAELEKWSGSQIRDKAQEYELINKHINSEGGLPPEDVTRCKKAAELSITLGGEPTEEDRMREYLRTIYSNHEVAFWFFPGDGSGYREGAARGVPFSDGDLSMMNGAVLIHNHPTGSSFSLADIVTACKCNFAQIWAVSPIGEYVMRPRKGFTYFSEFESEIVIEEFNAANREVFEALSPKVNRGEISIDQAERDHNHMVWELVSKRTGIQYTFREAGKNGE